MSIGVGNKRVRRRQDTSLSAQIISAVDEATGTIKNLTQNGLQLNIDHDMFIMPGENLTIITEEMGRLTGRVVWQKRSLIGICIHANSNTYAQTLSVLRQAS